MILPRPTSYHTLHVYGRSNCEACSESMDIAREMGVPLEAENIDFITGVPPAGWRGSWNVDVMAQLALQNMETPVLHYQGRFFRLSELRALHREFLARKEKEQEAPTHVEEAIGSFASV